MNVLSQYELTNSDGQFEYTSIYSSDEISWISRLLYETYFKSSFFFFLQYAYTVFYIIDIFK